MGSWKRYLLIGVTGYLLFLIINIPATLLLPQVNERLPNSSVSLSGAQGTIWSGTADIVIKPSGGSTLSGQVQLAWSFRFLDMLFGQLGVNYSVTGAELSASGQFSAGLGPIHLAIDSGTVGPSWINPLMRAQGVRISQPVTIDAISLDFDVQEKRADAAQGTLAWQGGSVAVKKPQAGTLTFPPVQGLISATEQQTLMIEIEEQAGKKQLVTVELLPTGYAQIKILKRVQPLIGMGQSGQPDATLLELKQKVL